MLLLLSFGLDLRSNPSQVDPAYKEIDVLMRAGKRAEAEQKALLVVNRSPTANGYGLLGHIYESQEKLPDAEKAYKKSLQLNPRYEIGKLRLGIVYGKAGKFAQCVAALQALGTRIHANPEALFYLCLSYLETGQRSKALETATVVARSTPNDPEALLSVVRLLAWKELYGDSLPLLKLTAERLPQSAKAHYLVALALFKTRQYDAVWAPLDRAHRLEPNSLETLLLYGTALLEANRLSEAKDYILRARKLEPNEPRSKYLEGQVLIAEGAYDRAIEHLNAMIRDGSKDPDVHLLLLSAYRRKGDIQVAVDYAVKVAQLFPDNPLARLNAGMDLQLMGRFPEAEAHLRKSVELAGNDPDILMKAKLNLASALVKQGNDAAARPLLEELVRLDKNDVSSRLELGDSYLRAGQYESALKVLQEAISLEPKNKRGHLLLGKALTRLDKHDQAREQFKIFQELESAEGDGKSSGK